VRVVRQAELVVSEGRINAENYNFSVHITEQNFL
jgi:hypothetical protein